MYTVLILAWCTISIPVVSSNITDISQKLKSNRNDTFSVGEVAAELLKKLNKSTKYSAVTNATNSNISRKQHSHKSRTFFKTIGGVSSKNVVKFNSYERITNVNNSSKVKSNETLKIRNTKSGPYHFSDDAKKSIPMFQKIHARITRSKDAVWATITLTFICVLLVLAVAQSRMWKDHYYTETQGVPLPNFNERVLFKDVMEHKIASLKQFFKKKKSKEKNVTELESLLPPSEWDD